MHRTLYRKRALPEIGLGGWAARSGVMETVGGDLRRRGDKNTIVRMSSASATATPRGKRVPAALGRASRILHKAIKRTRDDIGGMR